MRSNKLGLAKATGPVLSKDEQLKQIKDGNNRIGELRELKSPARVASVHSNDSPDGIGDKCSQESFSNRKGNS